MPRLTSTEPAWNAAAVTPDDNNDLANEGVLWVGTGGNVKVTTIGGDTVTLTDVQNGDVPPVRVKRVHSTDTTASDITVLY